jgi:hypothetical protein
MKKNYQFLFTPLLFCSIHLPSLMPRDSIHLLGCTWVAHGAGGGILVSWMSSIFLLHPFLVGGAGHGCRVLGAGMREQW